MEKYKYIFVVLVYRNLDVLDDFFKSQKDLNYKNIIVESFYDEETKIKCQQIAETNNCDYISIPNKGYGYGNNVGCEFAINKYLFEYLVISNSDIIIKDISYLDKVQINDAVIAPHVVMKNGNIQNPNIYVYSDLHYNLLKRANLNDQKGMKLLARLISGSTKNIVALFAKIFQIKQIKIFSPHGSFIIIPYNILKHLMPIFNENMFLYNEEVYFALKCKLNNVDVVYMPKIRILHLEGASSSSDSRKYYKQSFIELDKWRKETANL